MAQIGYYIHYLYENYKRYGITINGRSDSAQTAYDTQRLLLIQEATGRLMGKLNASHKSEIENSLNYMYGGSTSFSGEWTSENQQYLLSEIQKAIAHKLGLEMEQIDWDTLTVNSKGQLKRATYQSTKERFKIDTLKTRINQLKMVMEEINAKEKANRTEDEKNFLEAAEKMDTILEEFQNSLPEGKTYFSYKNGNTAKKLMADLNAFWVHWKKIASSYLSGQVGEMMAAAGLFVAKNKAKLTSKELIDKFVEELKINLQKQNQQKLGLVGNQRSAAVLVKSNFALQHLNKEDKTLYDKNTHFKNDEMFTDFGVAKPRMYYTQDKVDLTFDLEGVGTINASVKNYRRNASSITLHSGTSFLTMLQQFPNFVNHYLNITASMKGEKQKVAGANDEDIKKWNALFKQTVFYKGLIGGLLKYNKNEGLHKTQENQIVITNDKTTGRFKVYYVSELINTVLSPSGNYADLILLKGIQDNTTWTNQNKWMVYKSRTIGRHRDKNKSQKNVNAAFLRINRLLNSLHKYKVDLQVSPKIFDIKV